MITIEVLSTRLTLHLSLMQSHDHDFHDVLCWLPTVNGEASWKLNVMVTWGAYLTPMLNNSNREYQNDVSKWRSHVISHFITVLLSNGNFYSNYCHNLRTMHTTNNTVPRFYPLLGRKTSSSWLSERLKGWRLTESQEQRCSRSWGCYKKRHTS